MVRRFIWVKGKLEEQTHLPSVVVFLFLQAFCPTARAGPGPGEVNRMKRGEMEWGGPSQRAAKRRSSAGPTGFVCPQQIGWLCVITQ